MLMLFNLRVRKKIVLFHSLKCWEYNFTLRNLPTCFCSFMQQQFILSAVSKSKCKELLDLLPINNRKNKTNKKNPLEFEHTQACPVGQILSNHKGVDGLNFSSVL